MIEQFEQTYNNGVQSIRIKEYFLVLLDLTSLLALQIPFLRCTTNVISNISSLLIYLYDGYLFLGLELFFWHCNAYLWSALDAVRVGEISSILWGLGLFCCKASSHLWFKPAHQTKFYQMCSKQVGTKRFQNI